ncbi:MAG TPA: hypothetical protein VHK69_09600 [Chitinophagaceae bacterium]|jgi:hypothetical protein|nr:hypothetical protein [Chitinophagaceae bacterium]
MISNIAWTLAIFFCFCGATADKAESLEVYREAAVRIEKPEAAPATDNDNPFCPMLILN